jgi:hypothetical protein
MEEAFGLRSLVFALLVSSIIGEPPASYKDPKPKAKGPSSMNRHLSRRAQFAAVFRGNGEVKVISTRRFFARLASVVLGARGFEPPIPFA